jgi:site-specific recombinase XerD
MEEIGKYKRYLLLRNLSERTVNSYISNIINTSNKIGKNPIEVDENDLADFLTNEGKRTLSSSSQNLIINSFKSFYKIIHDRDFDKSILPRPKKEQKQPDILSVEEIKEVINSINNIKHKTIIIIMYSGALRVSEIINLKIKDIDSKNNKINIRSAKGKIDRFIPLDKNLTNIMREYWKCYRTNEYLFEGLTGNKYSVSSVQKIIKDAVKKLNIKKRISTHSIRHSAITHLIKNGSNLRVVQKLAGHKNINTTANYVKIYDADIMEIDSLLKKVL